MTTRGEARPSWGEILGPAHRGALTLIFMGVWLHAADSLLVATMLPSVVAEIGGAALVSWTVSLYEIGTIVTGAASGLLAARHGVRRPMAAAATLFALGCAVAALAPSMWVVLAGRLAQGLGGGGLMALAFVATSVMFPRRLIPLAIAATSGLWGVSAFLGPLIGGLFVEYADWRLGFWFFAGQAGAMALWLASGAGLSEERGAAAAEGGFPMRRLALLAAGVVAISYAGVEVAPLRTSLLMALGLAALIGFVRLDGARAEDRLLPAGADDLRTPTGVVLVMVASTAIGAIAITVFGPILMVGLHGASALQAGYVVACSSIGWTAAALVVANAPERADMGLIISGMAVTAVSVVGFLYAVPNGPLWLIAVFAGLEGVGFGMAWSFILRQTTALSAPEEAERAAAALSTVHRLGYAIGAAMLGIVANGFGFDEAADRETLRSVAIALFAASLPFALIGVAAAACFARFAAK